MRWHQVLPFGKGKDYYTPKDGNGSGDDKMPRMGWDGRIWGNGRHTALLSLCWDDWLGEGGGRERVDALVARR